MLPILVLLGILAGARGDDFVGYYVDSNDEVISAKCSYETTVSQQWSTTGSMGVCAETNDDKTEGTPTTNYYVGTTCAGPSASGNYLAIADDRSATVTVNFRCNPSCATITIFDASTSAAPSVSFIGCPDQLGLPPEARTVYRKLPAGASNSKGASRSTAPGSSGPSQAASGTMSSTSGVTESPSSGTGEKSDGGGGSSKTPVIVGAVVGSVGGIALVVAAFFLGRRFAARKRAVDSAKHPQNEGQGKPELQGTAMSPASGTDPATFGQVAWEQTNAPPSELPSNYPAAHQLPSEMGPYEFPASSDHYGYQGQPAQHVAPGQGQQYYPHQAQGQ